MKRAQILLVSILLAASALGATAQGAFAYRSDVWVNSDSFSARCLGFTDTYPQLLYSLERTQIAALGYTPQFSAIGPSFTTGAFLNGVYADYATYVHTHGDNYWTSSGTNSAILQDPGSTRCSDSSDRIYSSSIKSATAGGFFNIVIMSTCKLGANDSTMPGAFQIEKVKNNTQREFFLGYVYYTYDSDQLRFEQAFWSYVNGDPYHNRTLSQAFNYAASIGGYSAPDSSDPFQANWWGNPNFNGTPGWY